MKRKHVLISVAAAVAVAILVITIVVVRSRVQRHRVFRPAAGEAKPAAPRGIPPVEQWTATFQQLEGEDLEELLEAIESKHPDLYKKYSLAYLHARVLTETNEKAEAAEKLAPFLAKDNPYRELALYHRATIAADDAEASRYRLALISEHPRSPYRDAAIDDEIAWLAERDEPKPLLDFAAKIAPSAPTERRREMSARVVEALSDRDLNAAFARGMALLNGGTGDDAADRVVRALDKPEIVRRLTDEQLAMFGETFQQHRHYDRAIAYLRLAIQRVSAAKPQPQKVAPAAAVSKKKKKKAPPAKKKNVPKKAPAKKKAAAPAPPPPAANPRARLDELQFALGRSHFGAEQYVEAQQVYLAGAQATPDLRQKATFFWHAARAAQLRGDDKTGEQLMTNAIAVKGKHAATVAALTQRLRTRLKQRRFAEAGSDLAQLRRMSPNERAVLEGSLAYAVGVLAAGNANATLAALDSVPAVLRNDYDDAEFAYWRGRALEGRDPAAAVRNYLVVLRSTAPSHFDSFARKRLAAMNLTRELQVRDAQVAKHIAGKQWELAKRIQTDRVLLKSDRAQLQKLASIYREIPEYKSVLELAPASLPRFPDPGDDRDDLLMAMGLHDEAVGAIEQRWGIRPPRAGLTRSYALNLGSASRESIYAIEVMMKSVPKDFHPELLPVVVRRLLYPRYFYSFIAADAKRYEADPGMVLSIMREESRFNPRAKSAAAARGLLQFIITTARDIGQSVGLVDVEPEDLYDPRVIIRLGAKYIAELAEQFGGNRYRTAAAYNAGPKQVALWSRIQPAAGDDYFMTAVNFDETKHYIRKVMNSYEMYVSLYPSARSAGGSTVTPAGGRK